MGDDSKLRRSSVHVDVGEAERFLFRIVADNLAGDVALSLDAEEMEGPYRRSAQELRDLSSCLELAARFATAADVDTVRLGFRELFTLFTFDFEEVALRLDEVIDSNVDQATLELAEATCDAILARWKAAEALRSVKIVSPEPDAGGALTRDDLRERYRELLGETPHVGE